VAATTVVGAGVFALRGVSDARPHRSESSLAAVTDGTPGTASHEATVAAAPGTADALAPKTAAVDPGIVVGNAPVPNPVGVSPVIGPVEAARSTAPLVEPGRDRPSTLADGSSSPRVTLARRAVDALLAGDRATALLHYRELSRSNPGHDAYREAVRMLDPSGSTSSVERLSR
jgi:hypothetical protein